MIINLYKNNLFQSVFSEYNQNPAVDSNSIMLSFGELNKKTIEIQNILLFKGVKKDDRVILSAENSLEYILMILALWKLSAVPVLLNSRLEKEEFQKIVEIAKPKFIITDKNDFDFSDSLSVIKMFEMGSNLGGTTNRDETNLSSKIILFTSGSLGIPKGVVHTLGNIYNSVNNIDMIENYMQEDIFLLSLPLYHIGGLMIFFRSFFSGAKLLIPKSLKTETLVGEILGQNITVVSLVPTQLKRFVESKIQAPNHLRSIYLGGAATEEPLLNEAIKLGWKIKKVYGSTETCSMVAYFDLAKNKDKIGSSGMALPNNQIFIMNNNKELCKNYKIGEIGIKGNSLFISYIPEEKYGVNNIDGGVFFTGDLGFIDEQGFLFVQNRIKRVIISGGENIDPTEIELSIKKINGVNDVFVFGRKDEEWGETLCAFIESEFEFNVEYIKKELDGKIARFKMPKEIKTLKCFPRTSLGKIKYDYLERLFNESI